MDGHPIAAQRGSLDQSHCAHDGSQPQHDSPRADCTPYGQEISFTARLQTTACPPSYKFTGYERDPETAYMNDQGLDYAFARYYSSRLGRFLATDPLGGSVGDLQSHNAYAYTINNPLNAIDSSGADSCPPQAPAGTDCGPPPTAVGIGGYPDPSMLASIGLL